MEKEPKIENNNASFSANDLIDSHISESHLKYHKFFELKNEPNKIIRAESSGELKQKHKNKLELTELVEVAKKLYKELEEKYGICVPADFFIGKDKNDEDVAYSVVNKINGKHLGDVEKSEETLRQVETLYTSVAKYFFDKLKEGGLYLWDICSKSQYVYGRKFGEEKEKIYLIDTDIWLNNSRNGMYLVVYWLTRHMSGAERYFDTQFKQARSYISQFIDQPVQDNMSEADMKNVYGIKKFLNNEKSDYNPKSAIPNFE